MSKKSTRKSKSVPPVAPVVVEAKVVETKVVVEAAPAPTHEEIARRAYELYIARGATRGCEFQDWITAERELTTRAA
jgi:hypothetical protein